MKTLPSEILCVHDGEARAALVLHWGAWLPAELNPLYAEAIGALRSQGRRVIQTTNFQGNGGAVAVRRLFLEVIAAAVRREAHDVVAIASPGSARAYCRAFDFDDLLPDEPPRPWDLARDETGKPLPTRLIHLALDDVPAERMNLFGPFQP